MDEVLEWINSNSDFAFNFDNDILSETPFSGSIDLKEPKKEIEKLFYNSQFDIEYRSDIILIFPPQKKDYNISGKLTDANGSPLPFANIYLKDSQIGTQTDENGLYNLSATAYKNSIVVFSYLGYDSIEKMLQEMDGEFHPVMKFSTDLLGESITISDYLIKGITDDSNYASTLIDVVTVNESEHSSQLDVFNSVLLLPGIHSTDESSTNLNIRGSRQDQNLIVWENATLYDPGHIYGMVSSINPFTTDDITLYKNTYHPSFENRLGGVIDISLEDDISHKTSAGIGTTLTEAHAYLKTPILKNKIGLIFSGRKDIADLFDNPTVDSYLTKIFREQGPEFLPDDEVDRQSFKYSDLNGKLIFNLNEKIQLNSSYFYTNNDYSLSNFLSRGENEISNVNNTLRNSSAQNTELIFRPRRDNRFKIFYSRSTYENISNINIKEERNNTRIRETDVQNSILDNKIGIEHQLKKKFLFSWGYTYEQKNVEFTRDQQSDLEGSKRDSRNDKGTFHNVFANINFANQHFSLDIGNRSTYYLEEEKVRHTHRLSLKYQVGRNWSATTSAGLCNQYISQLEDFRNSEINAGNQVWILNYEVTRQVQTARKISFGLNYSAPSLLFDIEGYYNASSGISTLNNGELREDVGLANKGESKTFGIDVLLKKSFGKYSSWINYTLSKNEYFFKRISSNAFPSNIDQRHNFNWVHQFTYGPWSLNYTFNYKSGLPYSLPVGIIESGGMNNKTFEPEYDELNTERLPDYFRSDISIQRRFHFGNSGLHGDAILYMLNIFDRENTYSRDYFLTDPTGNRMMPIPYRIDKFLLRRTPQLLLRIHF